MKTFSALIALALVALEHRNKRRTLWRGSAENNSDLFALGRDVWQRR